MRISAKTDYAIRAMVELAAAATGDDPVAPVKAESIATAQKIPLRFLLNILADLRRVGLVDSRRGIDGGFRLGRDPQDITIADIIRYIDGPLAGVAGVRPENLEYDGSAEPLKDLWIALRASVRGVLEGVTLADVVEGSLPESVQARVHAPGAHVSR